MKDSVVKLHQIANNNKVIPGNYVAIVTQVCDGQAIRVTGEFTNTESLMVTMHCHCLSELMPEDTVLICITEDYQAIVVDKLMSQGDKLPKEQSSLGDYLILEENKPIRLRVGESTLEMDGNGDLYLGNAKVGINITAEGDIQVNGKTINLVGDSKLKLKAARVDIN